MDEHSSAWPARIAGRETVRLVAAGERAELVLLGPDPTTSDPVESDPASALVARVWRRQLSLREIETELAAMTRIEHPHLLPVVDVDTLRDGRIAAIVPRLDGPTVARLLERRAALSVGEAITLLAPLVSVLDALHSAGVAHGRVGLGRIRLDARGAPILLGLGGATLFERGLPPAQRADAVAGDLDGLRSAAARMLDHVDSGVAARERIRAALSAPDLELLRALTDALFSAASPAPVRTEEAEPRDRVRRTPSRIPVTVAVRRPRGPDRARAVSTVRSAVIAWSEGELTGGREVLARRWASLPRGARMAMVGGAAATVALVAAFTLVPDGSSRASPRLQGHAAARTAEPRVRASPGVSVAVSDPDSGPTRGDDPVAALAVLEPAREAALRDQDGSDLAAIDEPGSPAGGADRTVIASGGNAVLPAPPYRLAQGLGQAALVVADGDVRVLLVRTHDGWRIRDVTADGGGVP